MNVQQLLDVLNGIPDRDISITDEQREIIVHPQGLARVTAGPGSGKTEVLTVLLLRLLYIENGSVQKNSVSPESVFVTTFTKKAARNLQDRLATYRSYIVDEFPELAAVDVSELRIGTLHELCNDVMQEYRYPEYQNVRLMDEYEQSMLIYEHHDLVQSDDSIYHSFWSDFEYLFRPYEWQESWDYLPRKWLRAGALRKIFDRIINDRGDIDTMHESGGTWGVAASAFEEYEEILRDHYRCDFSHLQQYFLNFLDCPLGESFLNGEGEQGYEGIRWVLVDEYQDTNLVQERIYLKLAEKNPHNLVVVGDDDQAMYRFRGGSVECMVTFGEACHAFLDDVGPGDVTDYPLVTNFRSHDEIVDFCNDYITSFPVMQQEGARTEKPDLEPGAGINGAYTAVGVIEGSNLDDVATQFAETIRDLVEKEVVRDPSQCCLLLKSTRESPYNAEKYVRELGNVGLTVYNPRNKAFLEQEEVQVLMGALLSILDPDSECCPDDAGRPGSSIQESVENWISAYDEVAGQHPQLSSYVAQARKQIENAESGVYLDASLLELAYFILGRSPFDEWQGDPSRRLRLGKVTGILEAFQSTPVPNHPNISRGTIQIEDEGRVHTSWLYKFYYLPIGYLVRRDVDDIEDENVICPEGMVPIMTMHQAKGLEFPFVFVGHMGATAKASEAHELEDALARFPKDETRSFSRESAEDRARMDLIRQFYVAFSRAQHALALVGSKSQLRKDCIPGGPSADWLRQQVLNL